MMVVFGIDPGATGAIAVLDHSGKLLEVYDMPSHEGIVSAPLCADFIEQWRADDCEAWVEKVHAMPGNGASSMFKFGDAFGTIKGVLGGARIPVHLVTPSKWKATAGLSSDKTASRGLAIRLWPHLSHLFSRVKDDGRAEAALIARYGQQHSGTTSPRSVP